MLVLTPEGAIFEIDGKRNACYGHVRLFWSPNGCAMGWHETDWAFDINKVEIEGRSCFEFVLRGPYNGCTILESPLDQQTIELKAMVAYKSAVGAALKKW